MSDGQAGQVTAVDAEGRPRDAVDDVPGPQQAAAEEPASASASAAVGEVASEGADGMAPEGAAAPSGGPATRAGGQDAGEGPPAVQPPERSTADQEPERADDRAAPAATPAGTGAGPGPDDGTPDAGAPDAGAPEPWDVGRLQSAVEAILFVVDRPTTTVELAQVLDVPQPDAVAALAALRVELDEQRRGFELREVAGGWRLYTREEFAPFVERYMLDGQQARLTQASLETLAVVAYRQPVTRSRISAIRGVSVDGVIRTLLGRGLIEECGSEPDTGGLLYRTTPLFLEKLGLQSIDELPSLAPLLPELEAVEDVAPSS